MPALYDTFLIQEPLRQDPFAVTHNPNDTATRIDIYRKSILYFEERHRRRATERLKYELGLLYVQQGEWERALKVLKPLWEGVSWRREGWWPILAALGEVVRECAVRCGDGEMVIRGAWEGMNSCLKTGLDEDYDFSRCLDSVSNLNIRPQVMLLICFDGGLKDIRIKHEAQQEPGAANLDSNQLHHISLDTEPSTAEASAPVQSSPQDGLLGACDLTLSPGSKKILSFDLIPKDSGVVRVANITSTIETDSFEFRHIVAQADQMRQEDYWQQTTEGLTRTPAGNRSSNEIRIHPKPPKMRIEIPGLQKEYLTDETVTLEVEITNDEDDDAEVTLEARFLGQADTVPTLAWTNDATAPGLTEDPLTDWLKKQTPSNQLGHVEQSGRRKIHVTFMAGPQPTEAVLEIKALYHLIAEPDTPVTKLLVHEIVFDRPFEANYDFQPSIDPQPMPNYFHIAETKDSDNTAQGRHYHRSQWLP
ncbi:MAG: hypothetical protein Q9206_007275 [Seirophora lacunosa]